MNAIRQTQALNKRELELGIPPSASWHRDFADTAFIYIGGLPFDLSEGDIVTIFSQYGEPVYVNLVRDKETGKSKGFAFLKYEDQRSTDLAVDNLGGAEVVGRVLRVDHTRYKVKEGEVVADNTRGEEDEEVDKEPAEKGKRRERSESEERRPILKEEQELALLLRDQDEDDPMKEYLIQQKREEVAVAVREYEATHKKHKRSREHKHRDDRPRSHRHKDGEDRRDRRERSPRRKSRSRSPTRRSGRGRYDSEDSAAERRRRRRRDEDKPKKRRHESRSGSRSPYRDRRRER